MNIKTKTKNYWGGRAYSPTNWRLAKLLGRKVFSGVDAAEIILLF